MTPSTPLRTLSLPGDTPGSRAFTVGLFYTVDGAPRPGHRSETITVTWTNDGS